MLSHRGAWLRRGLWVLPLTILILESVGVVASAQKPAAPAPPPRDALAQMNDAIDALTRKVWPSVVQVVVSSYGARAEPGGRGGEASVVIGRQRSTGSGFVIDAEGYIMTNAHVVNGAQRVEVVMPAEKVDGTLATALSARSKTVPARIVGLASELDLALLKVEGVKLPALPLATYSEVRQAEKPRGVDGEQGIAERHETALKDREGGEEADELPRRHIARNKQRRGRDSGARALSPPSFQAAHARQLFDRFHSRSGQAE